MVLLALQFLRAAARRLKSGLRTPFTAPFKLWSVLPLCVAALSGVLTAPASAAEPDKVADWLRLVAQCSGAKTLRLGVIGFEPGSLPTTAAERVRVAIQAELSRQPGVETAAVRDAEDLQSLQEEVLGHAPDSVARQLHEAFLQVSALVFFKAAVRVGDGGNRVRFHLLAVLPNQLGCAPPSEEIERPLPESAALRDLDDTIAKAVTQVMDIRDPAPVADVTVCPFQNAGEEFSSCARVLTDLVVQHLVDARQSRSTPTLRTNRLSSIKRAEPGRCAAADTLASGTIEAENKRLWVNLEFSRGGAILVKPPRTQVFPQDLGCDAQLKSFFEYVSGTDAHADTKKLSLKTAKRPFARRDFLAIDIKAGADLSLYCWVLGKDRTSYLALPIPGHEDRARIAKGQTLRYPGADFDTRPVRLENPSDDLFGCFGSDRPLPPDLHDGWMSLSGSAAGGAPIEVKRDDTLRLLEMMRAQPGVVEAYAPVVVR